MDGVVLGDRLLETQRGLQLLVVTAREKCGPARFSGFHHVVFCREHASFQVKFCQATF